MARPPFRRPDLRSDGQPGFSTPEPGYTRAHNVPDRDEFRADAASKYVTGQPDEPTHEQTFNAGFDAGERFGYTFGFHNGAREAVTGLVGVSDRGRRYREGAQRGNFVGAPTTGLEEITQDQLTGEVASILAAYAILKTPQKVRAVLDALRALPGVDIAKLDIEQD